MREFRMIALTALLMTGLNAVAADHYTVDGQFITIPVKDAAQGEAKVVRLQVVGDKIIRVRATPEEQFPSKTSLMIVPQHSKAKYSVSEADGNVIVKTSAVKAMVNTATGRITVSWI